MLKKIVICLFLSSISFTAPWAFSAEASPAHFDNDPQFINGDPNYVPGPYPLEDVSQAKAFFQSKQAALVAAAEEGETRIFSLPDGEITFQVVKNEKTNVLGHFRNYFSLVRLAGGAPKAMDLLVDINSLDTAVPARNNRILMIFFESVKPDFGTALIHFDSFDLGGKTLDQLEEGPIYPLKASGTMTLNQVTKPVVANLHLRKQKDLWLVETAEPIRLFISEFDFKNRIYDLMKACNHKSISNVVEINAKLSLK